MRTLFINSVPETFSNPAYSRHYTLKKLFSEMGEVISLNLYKGKSSYVSKALSLFNIKRRIRISFKEVNIESFDIVVLTTIAYPGMKYIKKVCQKLNKILIIDCVEWASPEEKRFGKLSLSYIHNTKINEHLIDNKVRVISISSYFANYFQEKNIKTEIIPNLVDVGEIEYFKKNDHKKIELLFAGYPNKKDAINIAIEGMLLLDKDELSHFNLTIAGISEDNFFKKFKYLRKNKNIIKTFVTFAGKVSSERVAELYKESDFSVLIRNNALRVCNAGFPTKLLDSFKYSTPIIANLTSDIGKYLIDSNNGFVVKEFSANSFMNTLDRIYKLWNSKKLNIDELSKESFNTCIKCFDYLKYVNNINELIS